MKRLEGCLVIRKMEMCHAPFDGTVRVLFPTKHAIGGLPVRVDVKRLIHRNQYSESGWKIFRNSCAGDCVKKAASCIAEKEKIRWEGYSCEIPAVITNTDEYLDIVEKDHDRHVHGEDILHVIR